MRSLPLFFVRGQSGLVWRPVGHIPRAACARNKVEGIRRPARSGLPIPTRLAFSQSTILLVSQSDQLPDLIRNLIDRTQPEFMSRLPGQAGGAQQD